MHHLISALLLLLFASKALAVIYFEVENAQSMKLLNSAEILTKATNGGRQGVLYITWSERFCERDCDTFDAIDSFDELAESNLVDVIIVNIDTPSRWREIREKRFTELSRRWPNSIMSHASRNTTAPFGGYFNTTDWPLVIMQSTNGSIFHMRVDAETRAHDYYDWWGEKYFWHSHQALNSIAWRYFRNHREQAPIASDDLKYQEMMKLIQRSLELEVNYNNLDTHAALLFLGGDYTGALKQAKQAIDQAKLKGEDYADTTQLIEEIIAKL